MLPTNLTTNEVKNAAGTEVEFLRWRASERTVEFQKSGEAPNAENHLKVSHQEIGSGVDARRRSAVIGNQQIIGVSGAQREIKVSIVYDIPVGDVADYTAVNTLAAEVGSFTFLDGTGSTFLFAGTGVGHAAARDGSL